MGMIIRKALPEDARDYTNCHISIWQSAYKGIVPDEYLNNMPAEVEQLVKKHTNILKNPGDCEYYCAMLSNQMIGFIVINPCAGEIRAIYLLEAFWGRGYGKEMLDFAVDELKRVGQNEVFLWVFDGNTRAKRLYEKNNFSFDGTNRVVNKYGGVPLVQLRYVLNEYKNT